MMDPLKLIQILSDPDFSDKLDNAIAELSDVDLAGQAANAYIQLATRLNHKVKPRSIVLDISNPMTFNADGTEYDCDLCIKHNMRKNTELKCQIEAVIADGADLNDIQRKINEQLS